MPWTERTPMDERLQLVTDAQADRFTLNHRSEMQIVQSTEPTSCYHDAVSACRLQRTLARPVAES